MKIALLFVVVGCATVVVAEDAFVKQGVVPDALDETPPASIEVEYADGVSLEVGKELTPTQVQKHPVKINWNAEDGSLYLLCMTDPDAFSNENSTSREFLHYLVGNIPGNKVKEGDVLFDYIGSGPPKGTGLHRYTWVVYKQPGRIEYNQETVSSRSRQGRKYFSIRKYANDRKLGKPVAATFYVAQFDSYVPTLHASFTS